MIALLLILVLLGVALYFVPMDQNYKNGVYALIFIAAVVVLIKVLVPGALSV